MIRGDSRPTEQNRTEHKIGNDSVQVLKTSADLQSECKEKRERKSTHNISKGRSRFDHQGDKMIVTA